MSSDNGVYTIIFNSRNSTQKNTVLSSTGVVLPTQSYNTYSFDWNLLPQGKYKASFTFMSMAQTARLTIANSAIPQVYMNLGNANAIFNAVADIGFVNTASSSIGILVPAPYSTTISALYADKTTNQPFYIQRPSNNQMEIKIYDSVNPPNYYTDATASTATTAPFMPHYILTLYLELITE